MNVYLNTGCKRHHSLRLDPDIENKVYTDADKTINKFVLETGINAVKHHKLTELYEFVELFYYEKLERDELIENNKRYAVYNNYKITKKNNVIILYKGIEILGLILVTKSTDVKEHHLTEMIPVAKSVNDYYNKTTPYTAFLFAHINSFFIFTGKHNKEYKVFKVTSSYSKEVQNILGDKLKLLENFEDDKQEDREETVIYDKYCFTDCEFTSICHNHLIEQSENVLTPLELSRVKWDDKIKMLDRGVVEVTENVLHDFDINITPARQMQLNSYKDQKEIIEKARIREWVNGLKFPINYLDFETYQQIIPILKRTKAYDQVPFLFCNYKENKEDIENSEINPSNVDYFYKDYLEDQRLQFARKLIISTNNDGSIVVYNKTFEIMIINNLIKHFEKELDEIRENEDNNQEVDLAYKYEICDTIVNLKEIISRIVDLMDVFKLPNPMYYNVKQTGSYSIKKTYPVLMGYEVNPYSKLEINNGGDAMKIYAAAVFDSYRGYNISKTVKENLVKYCSLDVTSMAEMIKKLKRISIEN